MPNNCSPYPGRHKRINKPDYGTTKETPHNTVCAISQITPKETRPRLAAANLDRAVGCPRWGLGAASLSDVGRRLQHVCNWAATARRCLQG